MRAHAISGNGRVVLGNSNFSKAYAWIDEGKPIDLLKLVGASDGYAMNFDASRVALRTATDTTRLTLSERDDAVGCKRLLEYQIAGEAEAHAIPTR